MAVESHAARIQSSDQGLDNTKARILVRGFNVRGIPVYPEAGITEAKIDKFLASYLQQHGKKSRYTVNELHMAADELTRLYRVAGFIFHRAYIPAQEVKNQRVRIRVRTGVLSSVNVFQQDNYSAQLIQEAFSHLVGMPVEQLAIEQAMYKLNALPGLQVFGYFSSGSRPDETRLNLRVIEDDDFIARLSIDNYGAETTGLYRANLNASWINPFGLADTFQFGLMQSYDPQNSLYGYVQYRVPFFNYTTDWYINYSNSSYELGKQFEALLLIGSSHNTRTGFNFKPIFSSSGHWAFNTEYYLHSSDLKSDFSQQLDQKNTITRLQLQTDYLFRGQSFWTSGKLGGRQSTAKPSVGDQQNHSYQYASLGFGWNFKNAWLPDWKLQAHHQAAEEALGSIDKFLLTGLQRVRGTESGYLSVDTGTTAHAELSWGGPKFRFFIFSDMGEGKKLKEKSADKATIPKFNLASSGIGATWRISKSWNAKLQAANISQAEQTLNSEKTELSVKGDTYVMAELSYQVRL